MVRRKRSISYRSERERNRGRDRDKRQRKRLDNERNMLEMLSVMSACSLERREEAKGSAEAGAAEPGGSRDVPESGAGGASTMDDDRSASASPAFKPGTPNQTAFDPAAAAAGQYRQPPAQSKYSQLLAVIEDMGRDIRPTYSGSKSSAERLKRGIGHARILVRECLIETERSAKS
ncbi:cyclin-dependent kinase 2-associated protein 2-like [Amphibalanus amphitrite]|uniref:cyclin-dependent kinase 2-associated protein 2-like n=1 Tax=Amphibalanus amphitrite TaxID=1232801 RepID=UPI001C914069|nr:cyclin-dependent kinase 2-associated protein 2-like [Amphibalanus amphitrite]